MTSTPSPGLVLVVAVGSLWAWAGVAAGRRRRRPQPDAERGLRGTAALDRQVETEARRGLRELEDWLGASRRAAP